MEQNRIIDDLANHIATLQLGATTTIIWQTPPFVLQDVPAYQHGTLYLRSSAISVQHDPPSFCLDALANVCNIPEQSFCTTVLTGHNAHVLLLKFII